MTPKKYFSIYAIIIESYIFKYNMVLKLSRVFIDHSSEPGESFRILHRAQNLQHDIFGGVAKNH
jgi:hypothetical protein